MENSSLDLVVPSEAYRVLLYIAMLGAEIGETSLAGDIAQTLVDLRPDLPHAAIVLAVNEFSAGQHDHAMSRLEDVMGNFPDSQLARAMLGTFMQISDRVGWQAMLESVIEDGSDQCAVSLACSILGRPHPGAHTEEGQINSSSVSPVNAFWA